MKLIGERTRVVRAPTKHVGVLRNGVDAPMGFVREETKLVGAGTRPVDAPASHVDAPMSPIGTLTGFVDAPMSPVGTLTSVVDVPMSPVATLMSFVGATMGFVRSRRSFVELPMGYVGKVAKREAELGGHVIWPTSLEPSLLLPIIVWLRKKTAQNEKGRRFVTFFPSRSALASESEYQPPSVGASLAVAPSPLGASPVGASPPSG
jgi:hypothetical protein